MLQASHLLYSPAITRTCYLQANYTYSFVDISGLSKHEKKNSIGIEQIREIRVHFLSMILHKLEHFLFYFFIFFLPGWKREINPKNSGTIPSPAKTFDHLHVFVLFPGG